MKVARCVVALTVALTCLSPLAQADATPATVTDEANFVAQTNALRASHQLPPLKLHRVLTAKARGWAKTMAKDGSLRHSNLRNGVTVKWQKLGENVGRGGTVQALHDAFMASPSHNLNLLDPAWQYIGLGVAHTANGTIFVAEEFMQVRYPRQQKGTPTMGIRC